jgi:putative sigma-54 modulation protein
MNLLQHSFYMFLNSENGLYNVVYKRADGGYGVIEPIE